MILFAILSFIFGTIIGSFLNVLTLRLPLKKAVTGRSHCPHCKHILKPADLLPLFSYLALRGKCRYCRKSISPRYFTIEVITGFLFALAYLLLKPVDVLGYMFLVRAWFISSVLLSIFVIDLEHYLVLYKMVFVSSVVLFSFNLLIDFNKGFVFAESMALRGLFAGIGLMLFFGLIYVLSSGRWIGDGDVFLGFLLGFITPGLLIIINTFIAYGLGAICGVVLLATKRKKLGSEIPFGTFLAVSSIITLYLGEPIFHWYLNLIGLGYLLK